jgi:sporulation protein YlmC with PRC-barrel domain
LNRACAIDVLRVETVRGRFLGHVFDLRCNWVAGDAEGSLVDEVIYGKVGLAERLGFSVDEPDSVKWSQVKEIRDGVVVVDMEK